MRRACGAELLRGRVDGRDVAAVQAPAALRSCGGARSDLYGRLQCLTVSVQFIRLMFNHVSHLPFSISYFQLGELRASFP